jgi:alcohol dehydrogenase (cytochrome c)
MNIKNILLVTTLLVFFGCQGEEAAPPPLSEIAGGETGAESDLASHWINDEAIGNDQGPVTANDLLQGTADPSQWLLYGGDYANFRHSPIDDLTPETVGKLQVAWSFPTGTPEQFEVSPVIYDGIMYVTSSNNRLFALNAASGDLYWRYDHPLPSDLRICCGIVNRGAGVSGDLVLMATLDARLLAFNRLSGEIVWNVEIGPYADGFSATSAPLIVNDLAVIGVAGGEYGIRGYFDAYDVATGKRVWRHYTVPAAGEPGVETWAGDSYKNGGAPAWTSGAYDPETNILYWTTGNPAPDWNGNSRAGDNLYSNSLLAVNPATGERLWHFQFTPHDVWDYDGNTQIFLVDIERDGQTRKAIVQPNRNGFFYILDRSDGSFIDAAPYVQELNWAAMGEDGRPIVDPGAKPAEEPDFRVCPGNAGGMNGAWTAALNPDLGLAYVPVIESCQQYQKGIVAFVKGQPFMGGLPIGVDVATGKAHGHISAIDVSTGEVRWRFMDPNPMMGGVVSTAGGVLFTGNQEGFALALDAADGSELWRFRMGGGMRSQPVVYRADGRSYVAIGSGNSTTWAAFVGGPTMIPEGGQLFVFALAK